MVITIVLVFLSVNKCLVSVVDSLNPYFLPKLVPLTPALDAILEKVTLAFLNAGIKVDDA